MVGAELTREERMNTAHAYSLEAENWVERAHNAQDGMLGCCIELASWNARP